MLGAETVLAQRISTGAVTGRIAGERGPAKATGGRARGHVLIGEQPRALCPIRVCCYRWEEACRHAALQRKGLRC